MDNDTILVNEEALTEAFVPSHIYHREGQIKEIARCIAPALSGKSINNVFVVGPPGAGKTLIMRWILSEQFEKNSVYINCWNCRSEHKILEELLSRLGLVITGRESTDDLAKKLQKSVKRKVIVCLDEADHIREPNVLYTLARNGVGIIMISNHSFMNWNLDNRITSGLLLNEITFKPYSHQELFDILKDRASFAFRPGSVRQEIIKVISIMAGGDARVGLLMFKSAAKNAESKGLSQVTIEEVKQSLKGAKRLRQSYVLRKLNDHQKAIYEILKRKVRIASGQLFNEYKKSVDKPVVSRAYRGYMHAMVELGLVKVEGNGRWRKYVIT